LDIGFLKSLLAVVETGSIAAAARQQNLSSAAVSQRIRVLEQDFGCTLLNRSAHTASPTSECLRLLPDAGRLVREAERLVGSVDPTGLSGGFRLGAISTVLFDILPDVIQGFGYKAPRADLRVLPGSSKELYARVEAGDLDAALVVDPPFSPSKSMLLDPLVKQPFAHILPKTMEADSVSSLPWIIYDRSSWGGRLANKALARQISGSRILCELDSPETIALMVEKGAGQAILPVWNDMEKHYPGMMVCPFQGNESIQRDIVFVRRAENGGDPKSVLIWELAHRSARTSSK